MAARVIYRFANQNLVYSWNHPLSMLRTKSSLTFHLCLFTALGSVYGDTHGSDHWDEEETDTITDEVARFVVRFVDRVGTAAGISTDHLKSLYSLVPS